MLLLREGRYSWYWWRRLARRKFAIKRHKVLSRLCRRIVCLYLKSRSTFRLLVMKMTLYFALDMMNLLSLTLAFVSVNSFSEFNSLVIITFRVRRSRGEMYIGHGRLCACLSLAAFHTTARTRM